MPKILRLSCLSLAVCLLAAPACVSARSDLEEWQKRILKTLERQEERREEAGRDSRDGRQSGQNLRDQRARDAGAGAAAARAEQRYGGRALAVVPSGQGYRVRLLLDNGRVTTVDIAD